MQWVEVITVRSASSNAKMLTSALQELMRDVDRKADPERIRVFTRDKIDTDFCIVLFHDGETGRGDGSRIGLHIKEALKEFGLVHHTVWIEMEHSFGGRPF